ncbi:hypothetical protein [Nisaea sp.]
MSRIGPGDEGIVLLPGRARGEEGADSTSVRLNSRNTTKARIRQS